jgi:hypothetical protein
MSTTLIELTLGKSPPSKTLVEQSFNNDSEGDKIRNSFDELILPFDFYRGMGDKVPPKYLSPNVHNCDTDEIFKLDDKIIVGTYCNDGVIVPRTESIIFYDLYNCTPLISLIKGDKEYISFLHTWAIVGDSDVVDKQVRHWMETVSKKGDIAETVFAPRKGCNGRDTKYETAISDIMRISKKTIVLKRDISEIRGIANGEGVYFKKCGYHLWGN